jgi:hypothetical protein
MEVAKLQTEVGYELIGQFIDKRPEQIRPVLWTIALELSKLGVSAQDQADFALRQVYDLQTGDEDVASVEHVCRAYGAVHALGGGPATETIVCAVRDAYRAV